MARARAIVHVLLLSLLVTSLSFASFSYLREREAARARRGLSGVPVALRSSSTAPARGHFRGPVVTTQSLAFGVEFGDADYDGWFEKGLFPATRGAYPVMIVADIFWHCDRGLHIISRDYVRTPAARNLSEMAVEIRDARAPGGWRALVADGWFVEREYESSAVGIFRDAARSHRPGGVCDPDPQTRAVGVDVRVSFAPRLWAVKHFEGVRAGPSQQELPPPPRSVNKTFSVSATRAVPRSRFAMCAIFSFNNYMLRLWTDYWALLGIGTFYLYYNGPAADIPTLNATLGDLRAHVQFVQWPIQHWIDTDARDVTHGQPMAIVDCVARWRDAHEFFFFYDLDEFLVLPLHDGIASFVDDYAAADHGRGPVVALRTASAWTMFNLTWDGAPNVADLNVAHFASLDLWRGEPSGREKYFFNASAVELGPPTEDAAWTTGPRGDVIRNINIHGVYHAQAHPDAHVSILSIESMRWPAYHIHLLNTKTPERVSDGRHLFFPKDPVREESVGDLVRKALVRRREKRGAQ